MAVSLKRYKFYYFTSYNFKIHTIIGQLTQEFIPKNTLMSLNVNIVSIKVYCSKLNNIVAL